MSLLFCEPSVLIVYSSDANTRHSEVSQLLEDVQQELNEAKMDKHESARHQKKQELLDSMKRLFPGVYGRLIDLCEPVHKKLVNIYLCYCSTFQYKFHEQLHFLLIPVNHS